MLSVKGIYDKGIVKLLDPVPNPRRSLVIVTILEDEINLKTEDIRYGEGKTEDYESSKSIWETWKKNLMKYHEPFMIEREQPLNQQVRTELDALFN